MLHYELAVLEDANSFVQRMPTFVGAALCGRGCLCSQGRIGQCVTAFLCVASAPNRCLARGVKDFGGTAKWCLVS